MKKEKAITLISLVITILILIILVGVAINLTIGENGLFNRAKQAKEKYIETSAREKLELVLLSASAEKEVNKAYNSEEFLDNMLEEKEMEIDGDTVIVDNYTFIIDRENLKIQKVEGQNQIKIAKEVKSYKGKNTNNKYEVEILLIIESDVSIKTAILEKPDGTTLELEIDKIKLGKDLIIELDEYYKVIITTEDGKIENRKIVEKSVETIKTAGELSEFKDKVNSGLTYEGKTINLRENIDLSTVCGKDINGKSISWKPIGNDNATFNGTFNGNNYIIYNLYIENSNNDQALFGTSYGLIQNIIISEESSISCSNYSSSIVGFNYGTVKQCINNSTISASANGSAGIVAHNYGIVEECVNNGHIINAAQNCGGIVAYNLGIIRNCYNAGEIQGSKYVGGISGHDGSSGLKIKGEIYNCYSIGSISGSSYIGGILGCATSGYYYVSNSCWLSNSGPNYGINGDTRTNNDAIKLDSDTLKDYSLTLGDLFTSDIGKLDTNENVIYINNGYPILKWQIK